MLAEITVSGLRMSLPLTPGVAEDNWALRRGTFNEEMHFVAEGPAEVTASLYRFGQRLQAEINQNWTLIGTMLDCPAWSARLSRRRAVGPPSRAGGGPRGAARWR